MWDVAIEARWEAIRQLLRDEWSKGLDWRIEVTESSDGDEPWDVLAAYEWRDPQGLVHEGHRPGSGATLAAALDDLLARLRREKY